MLFSKPVSYAIRALVSLAESNNNDPVLSAQIAKDQSIPPQFLIKIMSTLTMAGLVGSVRGPGGGFKLLADPKTVSLLNILTLFEGLALTEECLLGLGKCGDNQSCPVHEKWKGPKSHLIAFLNETTIRDLASMMPEVRNKLLSQKLLPAS